MYRDRSLLPTQAIRLAALGSLAMEPKPYSALASEIRHLTASLIGPSLDLLGTSIELLRLEGLIDPATEETAPLDLTEAGRTEFDELMAAPLKMPINDVGRLVVTLKLRFLHLLDAEARALQVEQLMEMAENELARLNDLRTRHSDDPGLFGAWLDREIAEASARLDWFRTRAAS